MNEYIITETGAPTSLDPLDADQTQNLPVARMIYATPIEIDAADRMTSLLLSNFEYDKSSKTISLQMKAGLKYSDGKEITSDDIAFAVARMAYARPKFPVIENIEGLDEWIKKSDPLKSYPKGIKVDGNKVSIKLTKDHPHPLFRLCLELFSVIPKSCVDLKNNKITCEQIPGSGRYSIVKRDEKQILFKKRLTDPLPSEITFKYVQAAELEKELPKISSTAVIAGNESMFSGAELKSFEKTAAQYYLPAARFAVLQISPEREPFNDKMCRQAFVKQFRNEYEKLTKDYSPAESSIFTKLLSGYLSRKELDTELVNNAELQKCLVKMRINKISWGYVENEKNTAFVQAIIATIKALELNGEPQLFKSRKEMADKFVSGEISMFNAGSGFWAHDPAGDLQMLFTPNLHKPLNFITQDSTLQKLIKSLSEDQSNTSKYVTINKYLHDEALFNVYTHVRRFYFSKDKNRLKQIPQGAAAPTPWQVFQ
ncbi:MAG: ABC transporter substrate-binding protein [Bacteriovoracia bacterium]